MPCKHRRPFTHRGLGRLTGLIVVCGAVGGGALATGQEKPYPIFTAEQFVSAMKTVGQAFTAANASLGRNEFEDSKAFLAISRDRLATTITYWRDRKKDDAVRMLRNVLTKMDELDAALSADRVSGSDVEAIGKQVETGCVACHQIYREQDPATKGFRIASGEGRK